nr:BA14K family protein [Nitratireductor luteus]
MAWCRDRYRSYRASDNTFQPYKGPRRICRSPYGR